MIERTDIKVSRLMCSAIEALSKVKNLPVYERDEYIWLNVSSRTCRSYDMLKGLGEKNKGELYYVVLDIYTVHAAKIRDLTSKLKVKELFLKNDFEPEDYNNWLKIQN